MAQFEADVLAELARKLAAEKDLNRLLQRVVDASVAHIDGAEQAGITIIDNESVFTPACTDDLVRAVDEHQYGSGEGPCLAAALQREPVVRVEDLETDTRWPKFAAAAAALGIRSMLSFQLYTDTGHGDETIGVLNIYAGLPAAFSADSVHTGTLLAAHAAVAAAATTQSNNLRVALQSRDTIGQAKGILMERYKITDRQAFDLLISTSQRTHRKLVDVAVDLTGTGEFVVD